MEEISVIAQQAAYEATLRSVVRWLLKSEVAVHDEQVEIIKTYMIRIVMEKIPKAKRWSVAKEFKSWIAGLSKEQLQIYLDRLRLLRQSNSVEGNPDHNPAKETGTFILFATYSPADSDKVEQLYRIGGEATAYYALALWRSLQLEELQKGLNRNKSNPP